MGIHGWLVSPPGASGMRERERVEAIGNSTVELLIDSFFISRSSAWLSLFWHFLPWKWFFHFLPDLTGTPPPEGAQAFPNFPQFIQSCQVPVQADICLLSQSNFLPSQASPQKYPNSSCSLHYTGKLHYKTYVTLIWSKKDPQLRISWTIGWIALWLWNLCFGHVCFSFFSFPAYNENDDNMLVESF